MGCGKVNLWDGLKELGTESVPQGRNSFASYITPKSDFVPAHCISSHYE